MIDTLIKYQARVARMMSIIYQEDQEGGDQEDADLKRAMEAKFCGIQSCSSPETARILKRI
jgi:hypothetical protein